ncbi:MFS transporter [Microlunatus soli]|uniref:Na+/melibiose symporter n=1 Tax=Microlunatus soli TaxID=630515 RepID=A0A1H1MJ22_9ACTN|nr:MFS transporter [Microlunatus soli]SDR86748.1 Na+/melibiose symporter [Microlunatus soli]
MSIERSADPAPTRLGKVVAASMAGTVVEWYEFFLYASAATLVFGSQFFPDTGNPLDGIIAAFLTYAVGFVARPLGGIVFGHFGDKYGRKYLLQVSILMVGIATFLMGCIPTFASVGYLAPVILVVLRFIQGFAVGGEWGGAVLLVGEHAPDRSRGFWSSWPQAGVPAGNLLATIVLLILSNAMPETSFLSWGWRIAFFASAVIVFIGWYIRTKITDAPIFKQAQAEMEQEKAKSYGVVEVFKRYPRGVFTAMGLRLAENVVYYLVVTFTITYLKIVVKTDTTEILGLMAIAHAVHFCSIPLWGKLTDIVGRRPVYAAGVIWTAAWGFYAYRMFETAIPGVIVLAIIMGLIGHGLMYSGQPAIMAEMFPTRMRYSGVSLGYQVTSLVAGSLAPIIATALLDRFGSSTPIAIYLLICCVITGAAVFAARETRGASLHAVDDEDHQRLAAEGLVAEQRRSIQEP